jgi:hypothetical protein
MTEITEQDRQKAKLTFAVFHFIPYDMERHQLEIADAIAHAREAAFEAGRRAGIEEALHCIENVLETTGVWTENDIPRRMGMAKCIDVLSALLPPATDTTDEGETP